MAENTLTTPADGRHYLMVMPGQYTLSFRLPGDRQPGREPLRWPLYDARSALEFHWPNDPSTARDAHTTQYVVVGPDGEIRNPSYRIGSGKAELKNAYRHLVGKGNRIWMTALFLDHDTPGHRAWGDLHDGGVSWWEERLSLLRSDPLGKHAGWYHTRKGARYVFLLDPWIDHTIWTPLFLRVLARFSSLAPLPDDKEIDKLKDWTRLMRLPRVYRDGSRVREDYPMDLSAMEPINLLELLGVTEEELKSEAKRSTSSNSGRTTVEDARATPHAETSEEEECQALARTTLDRQCSYLRSGKVREGERHNSLLIAGRWVGEVVGWLNEDDAVRALVEASQDNMRHYPDSERERCIRDGLSFTRDEPRDLRDEVATRRWMFRKRESQKEGTSREVTLRCEAIASDVLVAARKSARRARDTQSLWHAALLVGEVSSWLDADDAVSGMLDDVCASGKLDLNDATLAVERGLRKGQAQLRDLAEEVRKTDMLLTRESARKTKYA